MTQYSLSNTERSVNLSILAKDAAVALIIKVAGLVLTYLLQIFLARWMGRTEYGIYEYVVTWSLLLAIFAGLGLPRVAVRLISEYRVKQEWSSLRGIIRGSWFLTALTSLLLCLAAAGIIILVNYYHHFIYAVPLLVGMGLVLLQALTQLQLETTRALEDVALAYAPSLVIWPCLVLCGGFILYQRNHSLTSLPMIEMSTTMLLVVIMFQLWLLGNKVDREVEPAAPVYFYRQWLGLALVLLLQRTFFTILDETDIIMVGSLIGPSAAGVYNAAAKTSRWVGFVLEVMVMVAAPAFAILHSQKNLPGLQKVVSRVTLWIFWPSLIVGLFILFLTQPILSIFGPGFLEAGPPLKVLVFGRIVSALCGTVGCLMVMTGHQNKSLPVFASSALINIVLNAIAIPKFGIVGAAMTTSFTLVVLNIWLTILVVKYIGVNPSFFFSLFSGKNQSITESSDSFDNR